MTALPATRSAQKLKPFKLAREATKYLILTFVLALMIAPLLLVWMSAMKTRLEVETDPLGLPQHWSLDNLVTAWTVGRYGTYVWNSIIITVPIVVGVVVLSCLAGYGFARLKFAGQKPLYYYLLLGLMVTVQSIMIPLFYDVKNLGLLGTHWAMILPSIGLGVPFGTFLMYSFFRRLPQELSDAARVDGCNEFQVFRSVILPLTSPAVSSLVVFEFMRAWNSFLLPLLFLNAESLRPITMGLLFFQGEYTADFSLIAAGVTIASLPIIVVYLIMQRQFLRGLTAGALKG
ncbi:MAG: carbohydrate ABC transporter permease [Chloroflexi bacterium]|nr:carbohydrate ABC transporter permease [Chloroflexota bacterium]